jgi:adenylosuccinate lyase
VFAERAMKILANKLGRDVAYKIMETAARKSAEQGRKLSEVLHEMPEARDHTDREALRDLENPDNYLGMAEEFQDRLLASAEEGSAGEPGREKE